MAQNPFCDKLLQKTCKMALSLLAYRPMYPLVDTKDTSAVEAAVQSAYLTLFPKGDRGFVPRVFGWVRDCFGGRFADYSPIDARYHDLEHTMQGTLCMAALLKGRHLAGVKPMLSEELLQLGLLAILLHDTGYLKKRSDRDGTGAKYTVTHVKRSAEFAAELLAAKGFDAAQINSIQNMIRCTGVDAALQGIPFHDDLERLLGWALGTSDLLGQMAAKDYVEKLPILFAEFAEAARYTNDRNHFVAMFNSAEELVSKTPAFWEQYVRGKLDREFGGLHKFLNDPYPTGPNLYLTQIEANMARLKQGLEEKTAVGAPG